jgi:hypothetical protein
MPPPADVSQVAAPMPPPPMPVPDTTLSAMPTTTYMPRSATTGEGRTSYPPMLLAGAALGILLLAGVIYFIINLGQTAVSSSPPPSAPMISQPVGPIQPVSTQTMTPTSPGAAPSSGAVAEAAPVGRWMTKTFDFYEFDKDGTGSRGSVNDGKPATTFSWAVVRNQLNLSISSKGSAVERVPFSYGPGGGTLYLRQPDGRYLEYTKSEQQ